MTTDLETYIYITQVVQAEAMMYGYRSWRRQWGDDRRCGGSLLWQMNDCWPGISWAIVDYYLRPKPAFYAVARVLKPLAIGVQREHYDWSVTHAESPKTSKYSLWIASSLLKEVSGKVELRFIYVQTGLEVREQRVWNDVRIQANGTTDIIVDDIIDYTVYSEPHVLAARLWVDNEVAARDVDWPQPFKYLDLSERGLNIQRDFESDDLQSLRVSTRAPVKCLVFEERDGIKVSDSAMDIMPGDEQFATIMGLKGDSLKYKYLGQ